MDHTRNIQRNKLNENNSVWNWYTRENGLGEEKWDMHLFNKINAGQQIQTEIDKCPNDTFSCIFFLFEYEHDMVEKLLQFLIGKVDTKLLKTVIL